MVFKNERQYFAFDVRLKEILIETACGNKRDKRTKRVDILNFHRLHSKICHGMRFKVGLCFDIHERSTRVCVIQHYNQIMFKI